MKIIDLIKTDKKEVIAAVCKSLSAGKLVIFPTETVYGAGVDATNQQAVDTLLAYKSRREGKPLSIAVPDIESAKKYVSVNQQAEDIYKRFLPGPVTVVSESLGVVATGVASEFGTLGVRIPDHDLMLAILKAYGKPITATSANASGKKRPYTIQDIFDGLSNKQKNLIDLVLDAGKLPPNQPSTVIDTTLSTPTTLRSGDISFETTTATELTSRSETETKKIAGTVLLKNWDQIKETGLIIGLEGVLGAGKTIFTKGVATFLQIEETLTSPTYSYIEEYEYTRHGINGRLYHADLWKIDQPEDVTRLEIDQLFQPNNVVVIEWWKQGGQVLLDSIQKAGIPFIPIKITETENGDRQLTIFKQ